MKIKFEPFDLLESVPKERNLDKYEDSSDLASRLIDKRITDMESIDSLMKNRKCMSDKEFISTLSPYASFTLDEKDIPRICSLINGIKYTDTGILSSSMRDESKFIDYHIVFNEDAGFDKDHIYTPGEISDLCYFDNALLLDEVKSGIWSFNDEYNRCDRYDEISTLGVPYDSYVYPESTSLKEYYKGSSLEYRLALYKYMRSHIKKYMLLREMSSSVGYLDSGISNISFSNDPYYTMVSSKLRDSNCDRRVGKLVKKYWR